MLNIREYCIQWDSGANFKAFEIPIELKPCVLASAYLTSALWMLLYAWENSE